jgi:DNA mismatch repair ATPase MutS
LAQTLFQYGFYVPASEAVTLCFDEITLCMGDQQDAARGLSSFASEILQVERIIQGIRAGKKWLVLMDELARTTNPVEGKAIVSALVDFLSQNGVHALITTHYEGVGSSCRRLRVKGFREDILKDEPLTLKNINRYIDYSLVEETGDTPPREAFRIMRLLGIDAELVESIANKMNKI